MQFEERIERARNQEFWLAHPVGGDSIYQDEGPRKEEGGTHSGTLSFDEKDNVDLPN